MSKVIAGLSEEDSISFTSRKSKITVHFNGRIEYKEIIKTDKESKLEFPLSPVFILIFILEFLLSLLFRWRGVSDDAVRIGTIFSCVYFVYVINSFSSRKSTKRNHAAEHMVYNANRKGVDLTLENVRKSKIFCEYCGSCYIGNVIFISLINIPLVIYTGFWIPYTFIFWLCRNLPKGIPLNPFTHLMQVGVTAEPSDFNLFISLLAMNMVKQIDEYKEINEEIGPQAVVGILDLEVGKLVRDNDFDFDTSNLKTIFNEKNGGLWPPFFLCLKVEIKKIYGIIFVILKKEVLIWM